MIKWVCQIDECDYEYNTPDGIPLPIEPYECFKHFCPLIKEKDMDQKKKEIATQFAKCIKEGMDVMNTIKSLHANGYEPDLVNKFMDDYGQKFNASPLEYQDNLATTKGELLTNLENLYE